MSDIKLFRIQQNSVEELPACYIFLEKHLQNLIEANLESLFGIRFLASEFPTGQEHRGRIDTLGIDENNRPVIIEYKLSSNEDVLNQGLYYLSWLKGNKGDFKWLVAKKLGEKFVSDINWSSPRLLCIAGGFTQPDKHAIKQVGNAEVEFVRYRYFGNNNDSNLLFETIITVNKKQKTDVKTKSEPKADVCNALFELYHHLQEYVFSLGDDVQLNNLKCYNAFKRTRNFVCVDTQVRKQALILWLSINPKTIVLEDGYTRDVSNIGHSGTGDLEVIIRSIQDLDRIKWLIQKSYENS